MSKRMKIVFIAVLLVETFVNVFQAIEIHNTQKEQEEQFYDHICAAAQDYENYQETGSVYKYESASMELRSACSIADLLDDSEDYQNIHGVLNTLLIYYGLCPNELELAPYYLEPLNDLIAALNDYTTDRNVADLYTKLENVRFEILKIQQEDAERHGICF